MNANYETNFPMLRPRARVWLVIATLLYPTMAGGLLAWWLPMKFSGKRWYFIRCKGVMSFGIERMVLRMLLTEERMIRSLQWWEG